MSDRKDLGGRPTKCTPEITDEIAGYLLEGQWIEHACALAGIQPSTYYLWIERGRKEASRIERGEDEGDVDAEREFPYLRFMEACERARAMADIELLDGIREAGLGVPKKSDEYRDYKALGWMLERRNPKLFRAQQETSLTISKAPKKKFNPDLLSDEALDELERAAAEQAEGDDGFSED